MDKYGKRSGEASPANVPGSGGDNLGIPNGNPTLKNDGYDYVDFAAMSRPLKAAGFKDYNGSTQMTIYALVRPTTTANNSSDQNGLVYFGMNEAYQTWAANSGWSGINLGVGTNRVNIRFGNTDGSVSGGGQQMTTTATDGLASVRAQLNGTNRAVFVNNNVIGTGTNAKALLGNSSDLGVGYTMAAVTPYRFLGGVAQILIYDRVLTADEITKVETYFNNVKAGRGGPANPIVSAVDKTLLTALIEAANSKEATIYTSNSWNAFASALNEAKTAASNGEIEQVGVDNAYYALRNAIKELQLLPSGVSTAVYGTPVLGGSELDPLWNTTATLPILKHLTMANGPTDGLGKVLWDNNNLYVLVRVKDPVLNNSSSNAYEKDSVEIFVDETNSKQATYGTGMGQYRVNYLNEKSFNPDSISAGFESFAKVVDGGYYIETKIPFKASVPAANRVIGFDLQINDAKATGGRQDIIMWHDETGQSYNNASQWGVVTLLGEQKLTVTGADGATSITTKDGTLQMLAGEPVIWSVTAEDGTETNAAIISETGLLSAKKNGVVRVTAQAIGSSLKGSTLITISGQESAVLTGPMTVEGGKNFDVDFSLAGSGKDVIALDTTINYDSDKLAFVSMDSLQENNFKLVGEVKSDGKIRIIAANIGNTDMANGLIRLTFKAIATDNSQIASIRVNQLTVANGVGQETEMAGATHTVQINKLDISGLQRLIAEAQSAHDAAIEGTYPGQYPSGSKATLQAAINAAQAVASTQGVSQAEIEEAILNLNVALQSFNDSRIKAIDGDFNNDNKVSIGDLAIIASAYGKNKDDSDWNAYRALDLNNNGMIDITDISILARKILN
ncbi:sugar-binding protein [Paenibacillus hexagrammi]|uniref:Cohesin domain-containing protein n=1 Tax=Paenibacillus hexagrammi TaxID=2908839 RepID=A0ABY3SCZ5_9BACL|nr:sugar-binding protein [Paenibacillus sp. YPD9-1]UJF31811.1 cohesin domain-containing protein [Paenibacillus sp. YPD9-1]